MLRKSFLLTVLLVFRVRALLTRVNDHSPGRRLDYLYFERINNERGNYHNRNRVIKVTHSNHDYHGLSRTFPSPFLPSTSNLWVTIMVILKAFQNPLPLFPRIPWPLWSMGVNQSLALTQIGNKYPRADETIMTGLRWKWIPTLIPHIALLFSRSTGSCHGKQLSLDASWQRFYCQCDQPSSSGFL